MEDLLFLCHRLPWPPDKGDKIRSYNVFKRLTTDYRVHLGAFVDEARDLEYLDEVKEHCVDTCIRPLGRGRALGRTLGALVTGRPITTARYADRVMHAWVERVLSQGSTRLALIYSSGVAPYVMHHGELRRVMDFVDVDSDKWRQYAARRHGVVRFLYEREAQRLGMLERQVAAQFDLSLFVSEAEAAFFRRQVPVARDKVRGIANGVDTEYWDPAHTYPNPYAPNARVVVFVGAMDYWANIHAAQWFAGTVWPLVRAGEPDAQLYIVGSRPASKVRALGRLAGVTVTGRVADVRPYLAHAHAVATPLLIARGIQNKVLEALAMGKVLLATPAAFEGIEDFAGRAGCISDHPKIVAAEAIRSLGSRYPLSVPEARAHVLARYGWAHLLDRYECALSGLPKRAIALPATSSRVLAGWTP